jgi:ribosomal protein S18 acetylase RimI-like enzyme
MNTEFTDIPIELSEALEAVSIAKVKLQSYAVERNSNEVQGTILSLDSESVRDQYFITWLYSLAKDDLDDSTLDDDFYNAITHRPHRGYCVYGYYIDGKIEGIIEVADNGDSWGIYWFYVNPKKHNLGIGQKLFNFVIDKFPDRSLELTVKDNNTSAIHIYKKYGFQITESYEMPLNGEDIIVHTMRREPALLESVETYFMDDFYKEWVGSFIETKAFNQLPEIDNHMDLTLNLDFMNEVVLRKI